MPHSPTSLQIQASPFCSLWNDDVTLERASELLDLLINKHGFNFNKNHEFAEKLLELILKYGDYVQSDDSNEEAAADRRKAA